ncbi:hypothetical protein FRC98_16335 [Lujinxingia vulgaris]|uniref:Uncharacterized protein n=1 Tax=Lujinxingia vulgaris TaxID=2600176 RepID=A0A5C6X8C8_9DELT|nr:hypothetical protein [Lujinxingia vulgaris]TXD35383.1 hypothetical protein FRC98_16335 [Lujinxingia vulgaris]
MLMLLVASACGQAADPLEASEDPDIIHRGFEAINHGPRYFEAPEDQFFDDPGLIVVNPDLNEREPLILSAESYWLADEDVAASTVDETTIRFPRNGYEHMRGYRAGHVVLSRTAVLRRHITRVELSEKEIIWHTREAELEEVVIHGEFHMDVLPGSTIPEDFDIVDTYLYPTIEAQRHDLYERRLVMYDINRRVLKQESGERETCELETCDIPCSDWEEGASQEAEFDPDTGEVIEEGPVDPATACMDWVRDNRSVYADDLSGPLLCPEGLTDEQCADIICSDMCEIDDGFDQPFDPENEPEAGPPGGGGVGAGFTFCLNPFDEEDLAEFESDFEQLCDLSIGGIDLTFSGETGSDFGGGNGSYTASFEFKLIPRVQVALGFKAGMKVKIWKPKVKAYAGVYTGFGYGATMTLSAELAVQYNWSKHYEFLIFSFNIFFVNLSAYVYAGLEVNFRLSIEGRIGYDYWRSNVNYLCINICVGGCSSFIKFYRSRWESNEEGDGGEWKTRDEAAGQTMCGLPGPDSLGVPGNFDGFRKVKFEAEASASVGLNVGVGARIGVGAPGAAIPLAGPGEYNLYFEPLQLSLQAGIRIAPPLCNYHYGLYLGGAAGIGIGLPLVGHIKKEWRLYGPIKLFGDDGTLSGFLGCGEFIPSEPYIVERSGCSNDQQCMDDAEPGTMARCFQRQCVKHDNVRVSLGWVANQDLDLYINKPSEGAVYNRATQPDLFSRQDCGGTCTSEEVGPFIENFTFPYNDEGEWLAWVVLNEAANNDATETDIIYTLEVEFGDGAMRQTIEGRIDSQTSNQSVVRFAICSPDATSARCQAQAGIIAEHDLPSDDDDVFESPNEF